MKNSWLKKSVVSDSGAVLVVVLGILALLTLIAVSFVFSSRMSMRASESYLRSVTANDIAEAGMANAIAILEANKRLRTGDALDPAVPITETYDSLRDGWRQIFSAPVVIEYTLTLPDSGTGSDTGLNPGDMVVNHTDNQTDTSEARYGATANVIAIDTANKRLYLNSISHALWSADDIIEQEPPMATPPVFQVAVSSVSKPDEVDLDGDSQFFTSNDIDDDGDGETDEADEARFGYDSIWQNYYDESGTLLGRYAVLVQDESSKINVNAAGNLAGWSTSHASNEGWSTNEINLATGLGATDENAAQIIRYKYGAFEGQPGLTATDDRIYIPGQGDNQWNPGNPTTFDDDDDNLNRYLYSHDGIDNDGDGIIDGTDHNRDGIVDALEYEGMNEPEEFRPLRPYRSSPWDYNSGTDDDSFVNETNEGDDQPILTLEQLEDPEGVGLPGFLTGTVSTSFDGVTNTSLERRHFISTLSNDRNLNQGGLLRVNPNFATKEQILAAVHTAYSLYGTGDNNAFERADLRNMQFAANVYDYRDPNSARTEIMDGAGNIFAGTEAIRINEVMIRAATSIYEPEYPQAEYPPPFDGLPNVYWTSVIPGSSGGAGSPRTIPGYLTNSGSVPNSSAETSGSATIILPDPPFTANGGPNGDGNYLFKLRMRVRGDGNAAIAADEGFEVDITDPIRTPTTYTATGVTSLGGASSNPIRWATLNSGSTAENWYVEEAIVELGGGGVSNTIEFRKPGTTGGTQDTVDVDWFYFSQEPDCEWIELVNLSPRTVNVNNWTIVSEYLKDEDESAGVKFRDESYEATLQIPVPVGEVEEAVGIPPIDQTTDPLSAHPQGSPKCVVFAIDRLGPLTGTDNVGEGGTDDTNGIDYLGTFVGGLWSNIQALAATQMVYQLNVTTSVYSGWIDFFGNEPLNDYSDDYYSHIPYADRPDGWVWKNISVGRISLYDAKGRLVDRVTYDAGNVAEGFSSLQRRMPMAYGDRLETNDKFMLRNFTASGLEIDQPVSADGNYDDWRPQNGEPGPSTPARSNCTLASSRYALIQYRMASHVDEGELVVGDTIRNTSKDPDEDAEIVFLDKAADCMVVDAVGEDPSTPLYPDSYPARWQSADTILNPNGDFDTVIRFIDAGAGTFEWDPATNLFRLNSGRVKNRPFSSSGEIGWVPMYNEDRALVRYHYIANDSTLQVGDIITNTDATQSGVILYVNPDLDYMILQSRLRTDFVGEWSPGEAITNDDLTFDTHITYIEPGDSSPMDAKEYYAVIGYTTTTTDPAIGDTITNNDGDPEDDDGQTAVVTAVDADADNDVMTVRGDYVNDVTLWDVDDPIANGLGFNERITSIETAHKAADVRRLADYFSTAAIDLEAGAATFLYAIQYDSTADDSDIEEGSVIRNVSNGETATLTAIDTENDWLFFQSSEVDNWAVTNNITGGTLFNTTITTAYDTNWNQSENWPGTDDPAVPLVAANAHLALQWNEDDGVQEGTYDVYRVINADPAGDISDEGTVYVGPVTITESPVAGQALATVILHNNGVGAADYHFLRAILAPPQYTFGRININTASHQVLQALPGIDASLATSIIRARNIEPFETIGDVLRVNDIDGNFTAEVFKNISNLITTRSDSYKIIVLGQGANDANGNGIIEDSEIISEKKIEMIYQR